MARGWESKAVEDQIAAAEARKELREREALSDSEIERRRRKEGLLVERARLERERLQAHKRRYLELLDRTVKHIEMELAKLEEPDSD
ncbi:MAG: hypothetical protein WAU45_09585 [Blastocatellia bacterium]